MREALREVAADLVDEAFLVPAGDGVELFRGDKRFRIGGGVQGIGDAVRRSERDGFTGEVFEGFPGGLEGSAPDGILVGGHGGIQRGNNLGGLEQLRGTVEGDRAGGIGSDDYARVPAGMTEEQHKDDKNDDGDNPFHVVYPKDPNTDG